MTTSTALPPPGWYSDPWNVAHWRWWDGHTWTGYTDRWYDVSEYPPAAEVMPSVDSSLPIRAGWTAVLGIVAGLALSVAVYFGATRVGVAWNNPLLTLTMQCGLWSGLLGACRVAVRRYGTGRFRDLGFRVRWIDPILGIAFGLAALIGVGFIAWGLQAIGIEPDRETLIDPLRRGPLAILVLVFIAVVGAPFVEEMFFRGLVQSGLVARWGLAIGIVGQATLFGLIHLGPTDARGNLGVFLLIAPVGAVLGLLRANFARLGPGMFTHAAYNAVIVTVVLTR